MVDRNFAALDQQTDLESGELAVQPPGAAEPKRLAISVIKALDKIGIARSPATAGTAASVTFDIDSADAVVRFTATADAVGEDGNGYSIAFESGAATASVYGAPGRATVTLAPGATTADVLTAVNDNDDIPFTLALTEGGPAINQVSLNEDVFTLSGGLDAEEAADIPLERGDILRWNPDLGIYENHHGHELFLPQQVGSENFDNPGHELFKRSTPPIVIPVGARYLLMNFGSHYSNLTLTAELQRSGSNHIIKVSDLELLPPSAHGAASKQTGSGLNCLTIADSVAVGSDVLLGLTSDRELLYASPSNTFAVPIRVEILS